MFIEKNYKLILKFYIILISFLSIYFLAGVNVVITYNAMTEWVVNYQGGFVRRGLIGELIFRLSDIFNLNLRFIFFLLQSSFYLIYYYLLYQLFKDFKPNYYILLAIFSPIFIVFPIAELEAIGRKEILIFILLLLSMHVYFKFLNNFFLILFISIFYPILILTHESSIFYCLFFISFIFLTSKKIDFIYVIKLFLFSLPTLICIYFVYSYPHTASDTSLMCERLEKIGEKCGLAAAFLSKRIDTHINEVSWDMISFIRYIFIFVVGFFSIFYLSKKTKFNKKLVNSYFYQKSFFFHLVILILPTLTMFIIAVDSGRWIHMSYSCTLIYYFGLLKNKYLVLDNNLFKLNLTNSNLKKLIYTLFFILVCLSWNPKAVYHEDLGSFPIYRAIEKTSNFYDNILKIEIFR